MIGDVGMAAGLGRGAGVALAAPALLALQRRGERTRGVGASGAGRAGEQPGVRHGGLGRAGATAGRGVDGLAQGLDDRLLADELCQTLMLAAACPSQGSTPARMASCSLSASPSAGSDEVVLGVGGGEVEEVLAHALVELQRLGLDAVEVAGAAEADGGVDVEHDREVWTQGGRGPARDLLELGDVDGAPGALVGEQRVDVAVGDDDHALGQRGQHDLVDVLGLVGGVDQGLGPRRQRAGGVVEHDAAQDRADVGAAGLAGEQHAVAELLEPVDEHPGLGGLAGTLTTLEGEEHPAFGEERIHADDPTAAYPPVSQASRRATSVRGASSR